ncbi:putative HIT-like protein [Clostridia bacterium]|nr:putative HIT-like protein [Clostridia bacterium]
MSDNCIFCSVIKGEIPANKVYEDDAMIVIPDIHPIAELHYLVIPKDHYATLAEMNAFSAGRLGIIFKKIPEIALKLGFGNGYRLVVNQGADAGQSVMHLHIHLLGGQKMNFNV